MSYSIISQPEVWTPVYNPVQFEVSSTDYTQCNFKYIADVYVNGVYRTTLKLIPNLSNKAIFEFNTILQQYVTYDLNVDKIGFNEATNTHCSYVIHFGQEYDASATCDGVVTSYPNLSTTGTFHAWNGTLSSAAWDTYTVSTYRVDYGGIKPFLTNQPTITSICPGDYAELMYIQGTKINTSPITYAVYELAIVTYDSLDNVVGQYSVPNTHYALDEKVLTVGVGYQNLMQAEINGSVTTSYGSLPIFKDSVAYYKVVLRDSEVNEVTEMKTYKIDKSKTINPRRFTFLGELGAMDSYTFTKTESHSNSIVKGEFTKLNTLATIRDRGRTVIDVNVIQKYTSNSGWLTEKESRWIAELFNSSEVYVIASAPIYCYTSSYTKGSAYWYLWLVPNAIEDTSVLQGQGIYLIDNNNTKVSGTITSYDVSTIVTNITVSGHTLSCGNFTDNNFVSEYTPIIVRNSDFTEKIKRTTKNISYKLDYELANGKTLQHN